MIALIRARHAEGSRPGERTDGRRLALVIEGGGMRGVVSAGMTAAVEQLGLTDAFDEVHGASAGAFNAAFLIAWQASYLAGLGIDSISLNPDSIVKTMRRLAGASEK